MTQQKQQRFSDALTELNSNGVFGQFAQDHASSQCNFSFRNHFLVAPFGEMPFLLWHPANPANLERALRRADSSAFISYRGWTVDRRRPARLTASIPDAPMPGGFTLSMSLTPQGLQLPTVESVNAERAHNTYSTFTNAIQRGFQGFVRMWVGGNMDNQVTACAEILFWLNHCEIDRPWNIWQRSHKEGPTLTSNEWTMDPYAETLRRKDWALQAA